MIEIRQKQEHLDFINRNLDSGFNKDNCVCLANLSDTGDIMAILVYYNFSKHSCDAAAVVKDPRGCTRSFFDVCFHYAFITAGKSRITCIASEDNEKSIRLITGLGFKKEGTLKRMFKEKDGVIFGLTAEECKWLRGK